MEEDKNQRSSEESLKKLPRSPKVTIHRACAVILTSPEATSHIDGASTQLRLPFGPSNICRSEPPRSSREFPRSFLRAEMELGEAQKSSPEALKSLEIGLKIKSIEFHEAIVNQ